MPSSFQKNLCSLYTDQKPILAEIVMKAMNYFLHIYFFQAKHI
jgi:hypothetical protein